MPILCANWWFNLGRFDVHVSMYTTGKYNYAPTKGYLDDTIKRFSELKHHIKYQIFCDIILLEDQRDVDIDIN